MKKHIKKIITCSITIISACSLPQLSHANGFQLFHELSTASTGMGALTARSDLTESAWFNPASIAMNRKIEVMAGMAFVAPFMKLDTPVGDDPEMKNMVYPLPYFYATAPYGDRLGFGLAVNVPYGLTTEWDEDWIGKYYAVKTELKPVFITPSVSYKVTDWLSLGVGAQIAYAEAKLEKSVSPKVPGLKTTLEGDDAAYGYVLSMLFKPHKDWSVGATYRSEVCFDLEGNARYNMAIPGFFSSDMELPLRLPATVNLGVSTTAIKDWKFSADILFTYWNSYESLDFYYEKAPGTGKAGLVRNPKDWDDTYAIKIGAEYALRPDIALRAGYIFDRTSIDDQFRDPSLPTNDMHYFAFGAAYTYRQFTFEGGYTYLISEDAKTSPYTKGLTGTYEGGANIFNFGARWAF